MMSAENTQITTHIFKSWLVCAERYSCLVRNCTFILSSVPVQGLARLRKHEGRNNKNR